MDYTTQVNSFLKELDDKQKQALEIAKNHLGTSFDITKCNAFKDYLSQQK